MGVERSGTSRRSFTRPHPVLRTGWGRKRGCLCGYALYTHIAPPELEPVNSSVMTLKSVGTTAVNSIARGHCPEEPSRRAALPFLEHSVYV
jgi:hypothetical protein